MVLHGGVRFNYALVLAITLSLLFWVVIVLTVSRLL